MWIKKKKEGEEEAGSSTLCTYILNKKWASGIENKLVGIKHLSTVNLELDITQVWIIDHCPKVRHQQPKGAELEQEEEESC